MAHAVAEGCEKASPESSEDGDVLDLANDEGWEDVGPDTEYISFCCLICGQHSNNMEHIVLHLRARHDLDLLELQSRLGM